MNISRMRLNHLKNPVGYRLDGLRFSWAAEGAKGKKQQAAQLQVAYDESFSRIAYDSGKSEAVSGICHEAVFGLEACTRYFWRVTVWTDAGECCESPTAYFETAKEGEPWHYSWITPEYCGGAFPLLRGGFNIDGEVARARAYVSGLGAFEFEVNGVKCGGEYMLPGFTAYESVVQYFTFDITGMLREGANVAGARLGYGWYMSRLMWPDPYGDRFALICEIRVEYADGRVEFFGTDSGWRSRGSEVVSGGIYEGESQDARLIVAGWSTPGADDFAGWSGVSGYMPEGIGELRARLSPPITIASAACEGGEAGCPAGCEGGEAGGPAARRAQNMQPDPFNRKPSLIITPKNEAVLDFGQNMTGWVSFECDEPEGREILLQHGEILHEGCFFNANLRSAKAEFRYISDGQRRMVRPYFTFFGFRYVKVSGMSGPVDAAKFTGRVIMSKMDRDGFITTPNGTLNKLIENIVWGQRGNYLDVPTDCPQRDERLGWTGDAQAFCGTGCFNMDAAAFFDKFLTDMRHEQAFYGGSIPWVVPIPKEKGKPASEDERHGSAAWADAAVIIPWTLYLHYGDRPMLARHYPLMKDFVDYLIGLDAQNGGHRLQQTGDHFADWLALDNFIEPKSCKGETDKYFIASAFYAYSAGLLARAAKAIGKAGDAEYYAGVAAEVREAILKEYFTETGRCAIDTQTAYVLSLFMELIPGKFVNRVSEALLKRLRRRNMKIETGFVGASYLSRTLSNSGLNGEAYTLLFNEECPSWFYEINLGATTIWERWDSVLPDGTLSDLTMNSLNHYAYGAVGEWIYRDVCGLNPVEEAPGFKKAVIAPKPDARLSWVNLSQATAAGKYEIAWRYEENGGWVLDVAIPFDCEASVRIPEQFKPVSVAERREGGNKSVATASTQNTFTLCAGHYTISAVPK